ncbi:MAG: LLM class flavin-dependent oxidoreductase [Chloroflexia bacterium]|nr:LLM class flavin-dependent oxidoreductase [Chloroflexia bacterium]
MNSVPLSVLDLVPLQSGIDSAGAIAESVALAQAAESLGYLRYWFAEHHNSRALATAAPEVMIQHVAGKTSTIRVGSGGVMLPNQAPLKIAEVFKLLNAIYPDRIDLGLGRAPGTDQRTALALRRTPEALQADDYPERLMELLAYGEDGAVASGSPAPIVAIPVDVALPPVYLLGSSGFSAQLAAQVGLGFSFASHINRQAAVPALQIYRERFQPSGWYEQPHAILACSVVVGETMEHAAQLLKVVEIATWQLITGQQQPLPTLEQAIANPLGEVQRLQIAQFMSNAFVGDAATVAAEVSAMARAAQADEVMLMVRVPEHEDRLRALRDLATEWRKLG